MTSSYDIWKTTDPRDTARSAALEDMRDQRLAEAIACAKRVGEMVAKEFSLDKCWAENIETAVVDAVMDSYDMHEE